METINNYFNDIVFVILVHCILVVLSAQLICIFGGKRFRWLGCVGLGLLLGAAISFGVTYLNSEYAVFWDDIVIGPLKDLLFFNEIIANIICLLICWVLPAGAASILCYMYEPGFHKNRKNTPIINKKQTVTEPEKKNGIFFTSGKHHSQTVIISSCILFLLIYLISGCSFIGFPWQNKFYDRNDYLIFSRSTGKHGILRIIYYPLIILTGKPCPDEVEYAIYKSIRIRDIQ